MSFSTTAPIMQRPMETCSDPLSNGSRNDGSLPKKSLYQPHKAPAVAYSAQPKIYANDPFNTSPRTAGFLGESLFHDMNNSVESSPRNPSRSIKHIQPPSAAAKVAAGKQNENKCLSSQQKIKSLIELCVKELNSGISCLKFNDQQGYKAAKYRFINHCNNLNEIVLSFKKSSLDTAFLSYIKESFSKLNREFLNVFGD